MHLPLVRVEGMQACHQGQAWTSLMKRRGCELLLRYGVGIGSSQSKGFALEIDWPVLSPSGWAGPIFRLDKWARVCWGSVKTSCLSLVHVELKRCLSFSRLLLCELV
jgi:hypothetical protein